jgi:hypothetical protein
MKSRIMRRSLCKMAVLSLIGVLGFAFDPATGQDRAKKRPADKKAAEQKAADKKAADKDADKKPPQKKEELSGRLPPYYKDVVDDAQREKIYTIQAEYANQIERLKQQLDDLEAERDRRVEAVLTPQQKAKVQAAQAQAKAKRTAKAKEKLKLPGKK